MRRKNPKSILVEGIDEEIRERMPERFRVLMKAYLEQQFRKFKI